MGTYIILGILIVIVIIAVIVSAGHMKGEGGCCGGGKDAVVAEEGKTLEQPKIAELWITISGMHCDACKNRVERRINQIDGAACQVDLRRNLAVVELDREISDGILINAIQALDYKVESVEHKEV